MSFSKSYPVAEKDSPKKKQRTINTSPTMVERDRVRRKLVVLNHIGKHSVLCRASFHASYICLCLLIVATPVHKYNIPHPFHTSEDVHNLMCKTDWSGGGRTLNHKLCCGLSHRPKKGTINNARVCQKQLCEHIKRCCFTGHHESRRALLPVWCRCKKRRMTNRTHL